MIPTFEEAEAACDAGEATALLQFIYDHEPAGVVHEVQFRTGLARVVREARRRAFEDALFATGVCATVAEMAEYLRIAGDA
jgi:hypothetical protein